MLAKTKTKRIYLLSAGIAILAACQMLPKAHPRFAIFYDEQTSARSLKDYDLLVFHPDGHPPLDSLDSKQKVLAYISIGEADEGQLTQAEQAVLAVKSNDTWNSQMVDVRQALWQDKIVDELAANAIKAGFDGFMLDTADSAIHLELTDPKNNAGMASAAVTIIARLRKTYPDALIMLNRGMEIWTAAAPHIDMILAESMLTDYDFKAQKAFKHDAENHYRYMAQLRRIKQAYPYLTLYSVDYWDMNDVNGVKKIYQQQRRNGLIPYVSTPQLDTVFNEPSA